MFKFGKIVRLLGIPCEENFEIVYGLVPNGCGKYVFYMATLSINPKLSHKYINGGIIVESKKYGFKDITICNGELREGDSEQILLVIIPYSAQIVTSATQVAGRYPTEAILCMKDGDFVEVSKSVSSKKIIYMAVKAGNELFLVKKTR